MADSTLAEQFRFQAKACAELGSPMYAELLGRGAENLAAGGVLADLLAPALGLSGPDAVALRLLGGVHRLVLERQAGALAAYYPSVGGRWEPEAGWRRFVEVLEEHAELIPQWLAKPPQTNEVGRATALMAGLLALPEAEKLPVRLIELGASAGLLQLAPRFGYRAAGRSWGPPSAVVIEDAWTGDLPSVSWWPEVISATGCDRYPLDATSAAGRLTLTSYCWPDQPARWERLRGALALAARRPPEVIAAAAGEFLAGQELADATVTVVWHSVMWQYLQPEEQSQVRAELARLAERATAGRPLAWLCLEPTRPAPGEPHEFQVRLTTWPGGITRVLGVAAPHGVPTRLGEAPT